MHNPFLVSLQKFQAPPPPPPPPLVHTHQNFYLWLCGTQYYTNLQLLRYYSAVALISSMQQPMARYLCSNLYNYARLKYLYRYCMYRYCVTKPTWTQLRTQPAYQLSHHIHVKGLLTKATRSGAMIPPTLANIEQVPIPVLLMK